MHARKRTPREPRFDFEWDEQRHNELLGRFLNSKAIWLHELDNSRGLCGPYIDSVTKPRNPWDSSYVSDAASAIGRAEAAYRQAPSDPSKARADFDTFAFKVMENAVRDAHRKAKGELVQHGHRVVYGEFHRVLGECWPISGGRYMCVRHDTGEQHIAASNYEAGTWLLETAGGISLGRKKARTAQLGDSAEQAEDKGQGNAFEEGGLEDYTPDDRPAEDRRNQTLDHDGYRERSPDNEGAVLDTRDDQGNDPDAAPSVKREPRYTGSCWAPWRLDMPPVALQWHPPRERPTIWCGGVLPDARDFMSGTSTPKGYRRRLSEGMRIFRALASADPVLARAAVLKAEGQTWSQIARQLGQRSPGALRQQYSRAVRAISVEG